MGCWTGTLITSSSVHTQMRAPSILHVALIYIWNRETEEIYIKTNTYCASEVMSALIPIMYNVL